MNTVFVGFFRTWMFIQCEKLNKYTSFVSPNIEQQRKKGLVDEL